MAKDDALRRVEVAVRIRQAAPSEDSASCIVVNSSRSTVSVADPTGAYGAAPSRGYKQDLIFDDRATNRELFERLVLGRMAQATAEHPDTLCFLAYGHTSSGKTHTIAGSDAEPGVLTLCVEELLRRDGAVEVSMLEVYLDGVQDLLAEGEPRRVRRRHSPQGTAIVVEDLTTCSLVSVEQWTAVSNFGMRSRRTAPTERNARSSRSHAIFTVKSRGVRLCLVDLAGSERQTVFSAQLNKESIAINKSLSRLSTVLEALSAQRLREDGSRSYVNFRDTTLTVLLQRYLSGASRTTFLACVHPAPEFFQETLSTLRYTQRLKKIKTTVLRTGGADDISALLTPSYGSAEHQRLLDELSRLRQQVRQSSQTAELAEQAHRQRIAELEATLKRQQSESQGSPLRGFGELPEGIPSPTAGLRGSEPSSPHRNAEERELRAKDTRRIAGWLLSRVLGDMPQLNVGYDDYFDGLFSADVQVIGYVSAMSCLPRRSAAGEDGDALAFLDVGDFAMGLSMVDAGIPPLVRLHCAPCHDHSAWESYEWDAAGHVVYVLAFFEAGGDDVDSVTEPGWQLSCCGGCASTQALLPIATVMCVPTSTPSAIKEEVLQRLITLQGEQEAALERKAGVDPPSFGSFSGSIDACLDSSLKRRLADDRTEPKEHPHQSLSGNTAMQVKEDSDASRHPEGAEQRNRRATDSPTLTTDSTGDSTALAQEMVRQTQGGSHVQTPFKESHHSASSSASASSSSPALPPPAEGQHGEHAAGPALEAAAPVGASAAQPTPENGDDEPCDLSLPSASAPPEPADTVADPADIHVPTQAPSQQSPQPPVLDVHGKRSGRRRGQRDVDVKGSGDRVVKKGGCHGCAVL